MVDEATQLQVEEAIAMVKLEPLGDPDISSQEPGDSWEAIVDPSCTALVPHGAVGTVHLRPGKLDAYGLPDFDDMDFDGEAMPIADKPQPKSSRQTGGIACSLTELNLRSSGVLCTLDRASHSKSPTHAATSTPKTAVRTSPAAKSAIKGSPPKLKNKQSSTQEKAVVKT